MRSMIDSRWSIRHNRLAVFILLVLIICTLLIYYNDILRPLMRTKSPASIVLETMHLAVVSCGKPNHQGIKDFTKPLDLSLTVIKSAAMFAKAPLHLHIFTEDEMKDLFDGEIDTWPYEVRKRIKHTIYSADYSSYLPQKLSNEWQRWYKPCGSFRLLLPMILKNITDAAIYSDSDVVFIKPIDELWAHLRLMKEENVVAIGPTADHPVGVSESNENFISHPDGSFQINSGILVMNFTRILNADWKMFHDKGGSVSDAPRKYGVDLLLPYYRKYKDAEHDQKLLNILYHFNPDMVYKLSCSWNFKENFCTDDENVCSPAEAGEAGAVHGISGSFFGDKNPTFQALYETFSEYTVGEDVEKNLYRPLLAKLGRAENTYCGKKSHIITKPLQNSLANIDFGKKRETP